mmetsp:Transcript_9462/g.27646  ORF Transcript_9462/g.27646 Transcript_9462/m.27646 type:complete len:239 (+) Transcript_9462:1649-2365(+)
MPMRAESGVRISWDMHARNLSLASFIASTRARSASAMRRSRSAVMSAPRQMRPVVRPSASRVTEAVTRMRVIFPRPVATACCASSPCTTAQSWLESGSCCTRSKPSSKVMLLPVTPESAQRPSSAFLDRMRSIEARTSCWEVALSSGRHQSLQPSASATLIPLSAAICLFHTAMRPSELVTMMGTPATLIMALRSSCSIRRSADTWLKSETSMSEATLTCPWSMVVVMSTLAITSPME